MKQYDIEVTDTYAGEPNYTYVRRYTCKAKSVRGAINWLSLNHGAGWVVDFHHSEFSRYNLRGACVCCFITESETD